MSPLPYACHHFPPAVIRHARWLYPRFTLSYRDVDELLAERGIEVSYETVRRWVVTFGPAISGNLRHLRDRGGPLRSPPASVKRARKLPEPIKAPAQVQRFLTIHDPVANLFHLRRDHRPVADYRNARAQAFQVWAEVAGAPPAA